MRRIEEDFQALAGTIINGVISELSDAANDWRATLSQRVALTLPVFDTAGQVAWCRRL